MNITALMIYGSCARGDNKPNSDVDVLAVHNADYYKMNAHNKFNIVYYSKELLHDRMTSGNLFCLHLAKEGKIIFDPDKILEKIINSFNYKSDYSSEISEASNLAWVLTKFSKSFDNYFYLNKKLAWCLRTIIISKSAQNRTPVFSLIDMVKFVKDESVIPIIEAKNNSQYIKGNILLMQAILNKWGLEKPVWLDEINNLNSAQFYFDDDTYAKYVTRTFKETGYSI